MIFGADISSMDETVRLGGRFYRDGREQTLPVILRDCGVSAVRLRLWNNPRAASGETYGAGGNDLACTVRIARACRAAGLPVMLDFHYSDFWADPARQIPPKAWAGDDLATLCRKVAAFTRETLCTLRDEGLEPAWVQIGNEITNGMLWPVGRLEQGDCREASFERLTALVRAGAQAARGASDANILLHLENSGNNGVFREWFDHMRGVPYDTIGMSYYPFWHGDFPALKANMDDMAVRYGKDLMIVETAYPFTGEHFSADRDARPLILHDGVTLSDGRPLPFPFTPQGQQAFLKQLLSVAASVTDGRCKGVWYWEPASIPVPGSTWATAAGRRYCGEEEKSGGNDWANQCLFDYAGNALPALTQLCAYAGEALT